MKGSSLTHRERVLLALDHRESDRVPIADICAGLQPAVRVELEEYLREDRGIGVEEYFEPLIDIKVVGPRYVGPGLGDGFDIWGVHRSAVSYGAGSYMEIDRYPLAGIENVAELDSHAWPNAEWFDYEGVVDDIKRLEGEGDYALIAMNGNIFESSWYMRGFEQIFLDLVLDPELAHGIFDRVTNFFIDHFSRILEAGQGRIDMVFTADDIGGQEGLLMSLDMWEEHIKPYHAKMNKVIHEYGAKVVYHSDGAIMKAVPGLMDMGIDVLEALQFDARGMNADVLKDKYGKRLCFEGGISVQKTLPFGTVDDVISEVEQRIKVLGRDGGYILGNYIHNTPLAHFSQSLFNDPIRNHQLIGCPDCTVYNFHLTQWPPDLSIFFIYK